MSKHHYFGSTAYTWRTADTLEEVIKGLAKDLGTQKFKTMKLTGDRQIAYTCKVHLPAGASYEIRSYMPHGVECSEYLDFQLLGVDGSCSLVEGSGNG